VWWTYFFDGLQLSEYTVVEHTVCFQDGVSKPEVVILLHIFASSSLSDLNSSNLVQRGSINKLDER